MKSVPLFCIFLLTAHLAFPQAIVSKVYSWERLLAEKNTGYVERMVFDGSAKGFSNISLQTVTLLANQPSQPAQQLDEEALVIVKEGELALTLGQKKKALGPGSITLLMPGDFFQLENKASQPLTYYFLRCTSNEVPDLDLYRLAGNSFWVDWHDVPYTSITQGGIRELFDGATIMAKRLKIDMITLTPGSSTPASQSHSAGKVLVIIDNPVQVTIDEVPHKAEAGDVVFLGAESAHLIQNTGSSKCTYLSVQLE
jgi:(S)-ureidoglycine aminohydrolase